MCEVCKWIADHAIGGDEDIAVIALPTATAVVALRKHALLRDVAVAVQQRFLSMANQSSIALYETVQAHGTNIIVSDRDHAHALVVPRFENDGLPYTWEGKRVSPKELQDVASKLKDATWTIGKKDITERTAEVIAERVPERITPPIKQTAKAHETPDFEDTKIQGPESHKSTNLGDVAEEIQTVVRTGPVEEKDYRIRNLTRRR